MIHGFCLAAAMVAAQQQPGAQPVNPPPVEVAHSDVFALRPEPKNNLSAGCIASSLKKPEETPKLPEKFLPLIGSATSHEIPAPKPIGPRG